MIAVLTAHDAAVLVGLIAGLPAIIGAIIAARRGVRSKQRVEAIAGKVTEVVEQVRSPNGVTTAAMVESHGKLLEAVAGEVHAISGHIDGVSRELGMQGQQLLAISVKLEEHLEEHAEG